MRVDRLLLSTLIVITVSELILKILFPELIFSQTFLPVQIGIVTISLFLLLFYIYSLGKKKLFDLVTAVSVIMIFVVMFIVVLVLPGISFNWLFLLLILFISVVVIHTFLKPKLTM